MNKMGTNTASPLLDQLIKAAEGVKPKENQPTFADQIIHVIEAESNKPTLKEVISEAGKMAKLNKIAQAMPGMGGGLRGLPGGNAGMGAGMGGGAPKGLEDIEGLPPTDIAQDDNDILPDEGEALDIGASESSPLGDETGLSEEATGDPAVAAIDQAIAALEEAKAKLTGGDELGDPDLADLGLGDIGGEEGLPGEDLATDDDFGADFGEPEDLGDEAGLLEDEPPSPMMGMM